MGRENLVNQDHEGEKYLDLLGLGILAQLPIPGRPDMVYRDFLEICGDHARPALANLESLPRDDPRFEQSREALRQAIFAQFIDPQRPAEAK